MASALWQALYGKYFVVRFFMFTSHGLHSSPCAGEGSLKVVDHEDLVATLVQGRDVRVVGVGVHNLLTLHVHIHGTHFRGCGVDVAGQPDSFLASKAHLSGS
jgi:hypothetical protein